MEQGIIQVSPSRANPNPNPNPEAEAEAEAEPDLHDALLHRHVGEERGEAGHGQAVADRDERESGGEMVDGLHVPGQG